jgi:hypothetical protein
MVGHYTEGEVEEARDKRIESVSGGAGRRKKAGPRAGLFTNG